jgi:hypothetical protein
MGLFDDRELKISRELHEILFSLLQYRGFTHGDIDVDASEVKRVIPERGGLTFVDPIKVKWKFLKTTIRRITAQEQDGSILIDVDNSPVDVKVVPK